MSPGTYSGGGTCRLRPHLLADLPQDGGLERHGLEERPHHAALLPGLQLAQFLYADATTWARGLELRDHSCPQPQGTGTGLTMHRSPAALFLLEGETTEGTDPLDLRVPRPQEDRALRMSMGPGWVLPREADTQRRRQEDSAKTAVTWPQARNTGGHQELERRRGPSPGALKGVQPCRPWHFRLLPLRLRENRRLH